MGNQLAWTRRKESALTPMESDYANGGPVWVGLCRSLASLEADSEMCFEYKGFRGINTCERKGLETGLGRGRC